MPEPDNMVMAKASFWSTNKSGKRDYISQSFGFRFAQTDIHIVVLLCNGVSYV